MTAEEDVRLAIAFCEAFNEHAEAECAYIRGLREAVADYRESLDKALQGFYDAIDSVLGGES